MNVLAHGVGQSQDLPLPLELVLQAGAVTVVISFLAAALLWRRTRLGGGVERRIRSRWWRWPARVAVLAVAVYLTGYALAGPRDASNPMAHAVFVWLWVGLVPVSVLFGPVWRAVNPLRTLYRLLRLADLRSRANPGPVKQWRGGMWPAAAGLFAFVWLELLAPGRADPRVLGFCVVGYVVVQLGLATAYGEEWFGIGDCFEVYSVMAGRLSPVRWWPWLSGLAEKPGGLGAAAFLAVWWGSTIFDSAQGSPAWAGLVQRTGYATVVGTVGLVVVCGVVLGGVHKLAGRLDVTNSLIPIAVGYTLAHYLTLLIVEAPRGVLLALHQPVTGWDPVLATGVVSVTQVALILVGHTLGVIVAHDRALAESPGRPPTATLADELPVVLFMIGCTWAGLFLLFVR